MREHVQSSVHQFSSSTAAGLLMNPHVDVLFNRSSAAFVPSETVQTYPGSEGLVNVSEPDN